MNSEIVQAKSSSYLLLFLDVTGWGGRLSAPPSPPRPAEAEVYRIPTALHHNEDKLVLPWACGFSPL
jgi:hypothetical protein